MAFSYKNKKGITYYLHVKEGRGGTPLYYFSREQNNAIDLPSGYVVKENKQTGMPYLKRK
ncbi:MAG: hypothetical protein J7L14_03890 [Candidatus Diapherotrites archaeon]|nr:hypothetical protein [Candidatus Diapherotrites archaeon]